MLDEKTIEKMFKEWSTSEDRHDGTFGNNNNFTRDIWVAERTFKAAINLLLPIIQKQDEAIQFYSDFNNSELARSTQKEVSEMIKRLGGEG